MSPVATTTVPRVVPLAPSIATRTAPPGAVQHLLDREHGVRDELVHVRGHLLALVPDDGHHAVRLHAPARR